MSHTLKELECLRAKGVVEKIAVAVAYVQLVVDVCRLAQCIHLENTIREHKISFGFL